MSKTMFTRDGMGRISRRSLLMTVPTLLAAPRLMAQGASAPLKMRAFNHMTLSVSDPKRSLDFYQGLFGMPIQARQGATSRWTLRRCRPASRSRSNACIG